MKPLSRRDFLKLVALTPFAWYTRPLIQHFGLGSKDAVPNIIILVYDAWAAGDTSLYGYPRDTMPNLVRFAKRAFVYHHHHSTGTFTVPGTASLLTGLYPWTHRALHIGGGIASEYLYHQIFSELNATHISLAYSQNPNSDVFLYQWKESIDRHVYSGAFDLQKQFVYNLPVFKNDGEIALTAFEENIFHKISDYDASLYLGPLFRLITRYKRSRLNYVYEHDYPKGLPDSTELFLLEDLVDGAIEMLKGQLEPYLAYLHFFPPHWPYQSNKGSFKKFRDGWQPEVAKPHPLVEVPFSDVTLISARDKYDEYLSSWDDELGRLYDYLQDSGTLDNSIVVITSDHGEMFGHGVNGHTTPLIFNPLAHIPLVISTPGQAERVDVYTNTSSIDILPSLAQLTGNPVPEWCEGGVLPGLGGVAESHRSIYVMDAKENSAFAPLRQFSVSLTKDRYRLTHYNYPEYQGFEFYDLVTDPDELQDLYPSQPKVSLEMKQELLDKINDVNRPYEHMDS